jgi:hypothetical protein
VDVIFSFNHHTGSRTVWIEGTITKAYDSSDEAGPVFTAASDTFPTFSGVGATVHAAVTDFKTRLPDWLETNPDARLGLR